MSVPAFRLRMSTLIREIFMFPLTATSLHFVCEATTPLRLETSTYRAGNNLRGALGNVMQRAYCAGDKRDPAHASTCPVCWLMAANERPGQERRGYALRPPFTGVQSAPDALKPGQRFEFGLTLFGSALRYLPYFILAVPEMGRLGVGAGRGQFALKQVWANNPLDSNARECILAENDSLVHSPTLTLAHSGIGATAERLALRGQLRLNFLTPARLIINDVLLRTPDFGVLFARLLKRLDELEDQFGSRSRRSFEEVQMLQSLADKVRLIEAQTHWEDVFSGSQRTGRPTPIGGFVGTATYSAPPEVWRPLLPWLLWGVVAQVGKDTVKGNGVFTVSEC